MKGVSLSKFASYCMSAGLLGYTKSQSINMQATPYILADFIDGALQLAVSVLHARGGC